MSIVVSADAPRPAPGGLSTDPADLPSELTAYATQGLDALHRTAAAHGDHVGAYAAALLEHPPPWTKMRQVYRRLWLVRRHGAERVNDANQARFEADAVNVGLIGGMLERDLDDPPPPTRQPVRRTGLSVTPITSPSGGGHECHHTPNSSHGEHPEAGRDLRRAEGVDAPVESWGNC